MLKLSSALYTVCEKNQTLFNYKNCTTRSQFIKIKFNLIKGFHLKVRKHNLMDKTFNNKSIYKLNNRLLNVIACTAFMDGHKMSSLYVIELFLCWGFHNLSICKYIHVHIVTFLFTRLKVLVHFRIQNKFQKTTILCKPVKCCIVIVDVFV